MSEGNFNLEKSVFSNDFVSYKVSKISPEIGLITRLKSNIGW